MSYAYTGNNSSHAYLPSHRQYRGEPSSLQERLQAVLPPWAGQWVAELRGYRIPFTQSGLDTSRSRIGLKSIVWGTIRRIFTVANALILLWFFTLWWGERTVFQDSMDKCVWESWEKWPQDATPHHIAFIADPQLVDPHTYPGRPWPLSTLTVKYTDQYMRRSFSSIQRNLGPDSVLFLGDLFDGGREWGTGKSTSPEKRYQKYGDSFWKKEYHRFVKIFSDQFNEGDGHSTEPRGRRMIASLPGNHDLGFGSGIQIPVRDRFQTYFGKGNRVDVIGNHTIISVDTPSLSAMDQPDPHTGSSGAGSGDGKLPNEQIWRESEEFLNNMNRHRAKAETEELRMLRNQSEGRLFEHRAVDILENAINQPPEWDIVGLPTILLTHIPLYRRPATPCGPLRERYPPSSDGELEEDDRNALSISGGYQYQNVLTQTISNDVVTKVGPNLVQVYSGDDHDYCEITHREFSGSPKEITVKSLSWAMGVRLPGFLLTSLWNPIDPATGKPTEHGPSTTIQNHLCLLPNQLSIFIHYGQLFGFTLIILLARAIALVLYYPKLGSASSTSPILPLSEQQSYVTASSSSTSSSTFIPRGLVTRATNAPPKIPHDAYPGLAEYEVEMNSKWKPEAHEHRRKQGTSPRSLSKIKREFLGSVKFVAGLVFMWYFFLILRW